MSTTLVTASHFSVNKKDKPPMTIHVGMAGSDGIVLAGDTLEWASPNADSPAILKYIRGAKGVSQHTQRVGRYLGIRRGEQAEKTGGNAPGVLEKPHQLQIDLAAQNASKTDDPRSE